MQAGGGYPSARASSMDSVSLTRMTPDPASAPSVELLWWSGCPSWERATEELRDEMAAAGLEPDSIVLREVATDEAAEREGFIGSPTIRVSGRDVQAIGDEPAGLTCRVYRLRDGRYSPLPDREDLRDALTVATHTATEGKQPMTDAQSEFSLGAQAPEFTLPDTEGNHHELGAPSGHSATVVVWTCNHCPYALAWHDRLIGVARDYATREVRFLAINSNYAVSHPADSYEAMQERVAAEDWPHPYLHDQSQEVARAWGAQTTPHVFALDEEIRLRYHGAPDADYNDPALEAFWLREALDDILEGREVRRAQTEPVGCGVKWKK